MANTNIGGMHFVRYSHSHKNDDYLEVTEEEKTAIKYEKLRWTEGRVIFMADPSNSTPYIARVNGKGLDYYPAKQGKQRKNRRLYLYIGYDSGGKDYSPHRKSQPGYYLYIVCKKASYENFEWRTKGEPRFRKLLLIKSNEPNDKDDENAYKMAKLFGKALVKQYYPVLEVNWEKTKPGDWYNDCILFDEEYRRIFRDILYCKLKGFERYLGSGEEKNS